MTLLILTQHPHNPSLINLAHEFEDHGYRCYFLKNNERPSFEDDLLLFDVDSVDGIDSIDDINLLKIKALICDKAKRILILANSFKLLEKFKEFECFISCDNILKRFFFT